ncbi:MAG: indole-3-glycerol phosphate synthase TrpC [Bacteroidota bacterium]
MNILDKIVAHKRQEVAERKERYPVKLMEESIYFDTPTVSLSAYLQRPDRHGIIAEFKRRSPSKGDINPYAKVEEVSIGYMQAGASALSVLTDQHFFGGKNADLTEARKFNFCPILRKDFIIDEYQILEARSIGADAILLIAACLTKEELHRLASFARSLGLEVLVELHAEEELGKLSPEANVVGVNNRDLQTFEVSISHSIQLFPKLPAEMVKISESGLNDPQAIVELRRVGFEGFLIGEYFMRDERPGQRCREFIQQIHRLEQLLDGAIA